MCNLRRFLERLTRFNLKLFPNKALLGAAEVIFLGHKISSKGVGPDPGKVKATKEMSMPQNVSQLRSLLGALSYYKRQLPKMAARTRPLNSLLRNGVKFEFSPHHERIVREMFDELSSPNVLAFPDFKDAISRSRKFRLVTDASADGLGVVIEQQQPGGSIRPLRYLSRITLDNERKWSISELECAAIVWSITRNWKMFYGIPSKEDLQPRYRLTDPSDLDVYFVGSSGIHPSSLRTSSDSSLGGLANASGRLANALGGLAATPDDGFAWGGGGASAFLGNGARFRAVRQVGGALSAA